MIRLIALIGAAFVVATSAIAAGSGLENTRPAFPAKFTGVNFQKALTASKRASKAIPERDEFETKAEYSARIASIAPAEDNLVFVFHGAAVGFSYDPDAGVITVTSSPDTSNYVELQSAEKIVGSYVGTNAYGAKALIRKLVKNSVGLLYDDKRLSYGQDHSVVLNHIEIQAQPNEARRLKGNIAIAYTVRPEAPFYSATTRGWGQPTLSDPYEETDHDQFIHVVPLQVHVFQFDTGRIIQTFDLESLVPRWREEYAATQREMTLRTALTE